MTGLLALLSIYVREMFFALLSFFKIPLSSTGSLMKIMFAAIAVLCFIVFAYLIIMRYSLSVREIIVLFALASFVIMFIFYPRVVFGSANENYQGQMLAGCSSSVPAFLMGMLIMRSGKLNEMCKNLPFFIIFNTFVSTVIIFFNSSDATILRDDSGFNYQTLSYFVAFTFALNIFYIKYWNTFENYAIFKKPIWNTLFQLLIPLHYLVLMLAGGRGAFVLIGILTVYYFAMDKSNFKKNLKNFILITIIILVVYIIISNYSFGFEGYERIFGFLEGKGDKLRESDWKKAIKYYSNHIVLGNGAGSDLYLFPVYSHNIFTEIAVEYGTIGLVVLVSLLGVFLKRILRQIKLDEKNHLVFLMFICGFTMNMFSGYYFTITIVWFALGYVFSSPIDNRSINVRIRIN